MKINYLFWLLIFYLPNSYTYSQVKSRKCLVTTTGEGESLKEAYTNAVNQGLFDLISQCGSGISMDVTSFYSKESTRESVEQNQYRSLIIGLEGLVSKFTVLDTSSRIMAGGRFFEVEATCQGRVYAEDKSSKKGFLEVYGLQPVYKHEKDHLDIEIFSEIRSYVYIFQLFNDDLTLLYPNANFNDPDFIINANEKADFPPQSLDFDFEIQNDFEDNEVFDLIFVAASRPISVKSQLTIDEIIELYSGLTFRKDIKIIKVAIKR